jgi:UDP:flavonoid glycosyltransferase YjiC (YdhE family)
MKVLITTHPGLAHFHPMIPLARELQRRGHEVVVACAKSFCPRVEAFGLGSVAAGLDWLESAADKFFPELEKSFEEVSESWFLTEVFADTAAHKIIPDLLEVCRYWRPDVIVRSTYEFGACIVAELLDIPHATFGIDFYISPSQFKPLIYDQMAYLRSAHGLSPYPVFDALYKYLYFSFLPASYEPPYVRLPAVSHLQRPTIIDAARTEALPEWVARLPERPTVYATLGSVFSRGKKVFRAIIEALRDERVNIIMTTGPDQDLSGLGSLPDNLRIERYIPQSLLLPHCDLVIAQGGSNVVMSALSNGLPLLLIPQLGSNYAHAKRCVELKCGLAVKGICRAPDYFEDQAPELSPGAIRKAVTELLEDPVYKKNAERMRDEIRSMPASDRAATLLEKLAKERTPQPA